MSSLQHYPLGDVLPKSPHAVVCSLPTMADVCGYEENDSRVLEAMSAGYPRFVLHPYVRELIAHYMNREELSRRAGLLICGSHFSTAIFEYTERQIEVLEVEPDLYLLHCAESEEALARQLRLYVQHVGCGLSSRQAEDLLLQIGRLPVLHAEVTFAGDAEAEVLQVVGELCDCARSAVRMCASGMGAFYAAFSAVQQIQRSKGRKQWLQLGWLYLDTGCILQGFLGDGESLEICYDVKDIDGLLGKIGSCGGDLAGVVVECPTNPLVQVVDLMRVYDAVRAAGGLLIVDPTIASIYNMDVLRYADVLVSSLTKYASSEGDVMIGALVLNKASANYAELSLGVSDYCLSPYSRDLSRLAHEMQSAPSVVGQMNVNAQRLIEFLRVHPAVLKVHCAVDYSSFVGLSKGALCGGAIITIELAGPLASVYDAIRCMKGPSFGTQYTLVSPFMYLAHYDLVSTAKGREFLAGVGIDPELLRISVGIEPYIEIEAIFKQALDLLLV